MASEAVAPNEDSQYNILEIKRMLEGLLENGEEDDIVSFIDKCYDADIRFSETYVLRIESAVGSGTKVTVRIKDCRRSN
jgi:hypothetical protein